jgi:hypothetical protein
MDLTQELQILCYYLPEHGGRQSAITFPESDDIITR